MMEQQAIPGTPSRRTMLVFCAVVAVLGIAVFGRSVTYGFVEWDDTALIVRNAAVHGLGPSTLWKAFTSYDPELYIPLTLLSYQADWAVSEGSAGWFHAVNLMLHIVNALLVALLALRLTRRPGIAASVSLLFLLHPLAVEAAVWVSARKDLLSTGFFLLSALGYLAWRRGNRKAYAWSLVAFLLALLAKVSAAPLPFALLLFDAWQGRKIDGKALKEKWPYLALMAPFLVIAYAGKQGRVAGAGFFLETLLLVPRSTLFLLGKVVLPWNLAPLYPYTRPITLVSSDLLAAIAGSLILSLVLWRYRRALPHLWYGALFFLLCLVPNFMNFHKGDDYLDIYLTTDRYAYLPNAGLFLGLVLTASALLAALRNPRVRLAAGVTAIAAVTALSAWLSFRQAGIWRDTETLFTAVLARSPNAQVARVVMGGIAYAKGDLEGAHREYVTAIGIRPTPLAFINLGVVFLDTKEYDRAIEANRRALALNARASSAQMNIGVAYMGKGRYAEAAEAFRATAAMDPKAIAAYINLGIAEEKLNHPDAAKEAYGKALEIDPASRIAGERLTALEADR